MSHPNDPYGGGYPPPGGPQPGGQPGYGAPPPHGGGYPPNQGGFPPHAGYGPGYPPAAKRGNTGLIIGGIVGGVVLLLIVVVVIASASRDTPSRPSSYVAPSPAPSSQSAIPAMSASFLLGRWGPSPCDVYVEFRSNGVAYAPRTGNQTYTISGSTVSMSRGTETVESLWTPTGPNSARVLENGETYNVIRC